MNSGLCGKCNGDLDPGGTYCPHCGATVQPAPVQAAWESPAQYSAPFADPGVPTTVEPMTGGEFGGPWTTETGMSRTASDQHTRWEGSHSTHIAHLIVKRGVPQGRAFEIGDNAAIGRDRRSNSIVLGQDESISRQHAQIRLEDGSFVYYNLSGSYGSYLLTARGRQRIDARLVLCDGDEIEIGERTVLSFRQSS